MTFYLWKNTGMCLKRSNSSFLLTSKICVFLFFPRINTYPDIDLLTEGDSSPKLLCKSPCTQLDAFEYKHENDSSFQNRTLLARMLYCFNSAFKFEIKKKKTPQLSYYCTNSLFFRTESDLSRRAHKQSACFGNSWLALWLQSANFLAVSEPAWDGTQGSKHVPVGDSAMGKPHYSSSPSASSSPLSCSSPKGIKQARPTVDYPASYGQERPSLLAGAPCCAFCWVSITTCAGINGAGVPKGRLLPVSLRIGDTVTYSFLLTTRPCPALHYPLEF